MTSSHSKAPFGIVTLASSGSEGGSSRAMGAMRQAQTAGYGVLPPPLTQQRHTTSDASGGGSGSDVSQMANTFMAQAYDLDDKWSGDQGPVEIPLATASLLENTGGLLRPPPFDSSTAGRARQPISDLSVRSAAV